MKYMVPCRVIGGNDRGASDWSAEVARAELAAENTLRATEVTWDQALLGAIAESEGFAVDDEDAAYYGQAADNLRRWAAAYRAAEEAANAAAELPESCRRAGIGVMLGER